MSAQPKRPRRGRRAVPRFLAPGAGGNDHGYRSEPKRKLPSRSEPRPETYDRLLLDQAASVAEARSMVDETECVGPAIVDAYGEDARFFCSARHAREVEEARQVRGTLKAEDRLRDAQRRARQSKRRDLSGEFVAIRAMLARAVRGGGEPKPSSAVMVRIERAERILDGVDEG